MLSKNAIKVISHDAIKGSILSYVRKKLGEERKFQILDLLIPRERKIRSIVGGLETSLGTTLWEPLAKALAEANGFQIINEKLKAPANMPANLGNALKNIIEERKRGSDAYDGKKSHREIKRVCQVFKQRPIDTFVNPPSGHGVDIRLRKNGVDYFFDTKTVQPNIGDYARFLEQVLSWYAYYYARNPDGKAEARIVFPYNPYTGNFWDNTIKNGLPLEKDTEGWVGDQFWSFCSGVEGTYDIIKDVIIEINKTKELENELAAIFEEDE